MSRWSRAEKALLLLGLAGVDFWLLSNAEKSIYQAWQGWVFERQLRGERADAGAFVEEKEGQLAEWLGMAPGKHASSQPGPPAQINPPRGEEAKAREPRRPEIPVDGVIGRLTIPRLRMSAMVRQGVDEDTLRVALGHIPGTVLPGQSGNVGIAGHRDTLFRALRRIRKNDVILFETLGGRYEYRVELTRVVNPRDVGVLDSKAVPELTLVTCYPFYYIGSAPERFIVKARQQAGA
ncbi:MAG TPA: class D sortase [Bryobacteraceae bacterium]|nr:class D sortase [Bryobacteraceae bacterium]